MDFQKWLCEGSMHCCEALEKASVVVVTGPGPVDAGGGVGSELRPDKRKVSGSWLCFRLARGEMAKTLKLPAFSGQCSGCQ